MKFYLLFLLQIFIIIWLIEFYLWHYKVYIIEYFDTPLFLSLNNHHILVLISDEHCILTTLNHVRCNRKQRMYQLKNIEWFSYIRNVDFSMLVLVLFNSINK